MSNKNHRPKLQFSGFMSTRSTEYGGVSEHHVREAIEDMSEEDLRMWMKVNFEVVLSQ